MKWVWSAGLVVVLGAIIAFAMTPARFVTDQVNARDPSVRYAVASGTVWNGRVENVMYGIQPVGDVAFRTNLTALLTGVVSGEFSLSGGSITGEGKVSSGLGGRTRLADIRAMGGTRDLLNLQQEVRDLNGQFRLNLSELVIDNQHCETAEGTVWTDILTRTEARWNWIGPELSGPVSCADGDLLVVLSGATPAGERVNASLEVGLDARGSFFAEVFTQNSDTANALSLLGFVSEGQDRYTYRHSIE